MERNDFTGNGKLQSKMLLVFSGGISTVKTLENSLSVFLEESYPDQNRVEDILKNLRKQENTADGCFY